MRQECRGPRSLIVYIRRFNVKSHEQQFSRVSLYACQVPKCAVQQFPPADFTPVWRWIWPFGPVCGFSPRTGDCRAASVRCGFSRFGEVEVELGWMICAPRRAGYLPSRTRANLISPERAGESVSRSGKANLRTRLRGSFRRYRFRPWWFLTRRLLHLTVFEEWCPVPSTAIGNDLRARSGFPVPRRKAAWHLREAPAQGPRVDLVEAPAHPDGDCWLARATPNSACRFRAITGSPPPRVFRSNRGRDGVLKKNTARPDIRQSERPVPRVLIGSGMPPKCCRIVFSIPGIDRCLRKGFLSCSRPVLP